ncbi:TonB family protein [Brevundimonas sp.]|uniref:energy transducer TonB n=1 Tax=Brevundimonas sp. TaxID=1871086 RepID=UPI003D0A30E2
MILSPDISDRPIWGRSLAIVGGAHLLAIGLLFVRISPTLDLSNEMPAIAVEMASPAAIPAPMLDVPTPQQVEAPEQTPPKPREPKELPFDPPPEIRQANLNPVVVLPLRTEERPRPEDSTPLPPAPATTQAAAPDLRPAERNTAPLTGGASAGRATASDVWDARVRARIELTKRYPGQAARQDQEDNVSVLMTLDRNGRLLDARIRNSRGFALLDEAALDAVRRAAPFPAPPEDITGERIRLSVIVRFYKRGR